MAGVGRGGEMFFLGGVSIRRGRVLTGAGRFRSAGENISGGGSSGPVTFRRGGEFSFCKCGGRLWEIGVAGCGLEDGDV